MWHNNHNTLHIYNIYIYYKVIKYNENILFQGVVNEHDAKTNNKRTPIEIYKNVYIEFER